MPNRVQRTCDKTVVVLMVLLLLMGLVTLFSATYYQKAATGDALAAVKKQLIGVALGAAACVTLSRVPYRVFRRPKVTLLLLATSALLLILVIIPGVGVSINGSRRWLNFFGLSMHLPSTRWSFSWPGRWIAAARRSVICSRALCRCWLCRA